MKKIMGVLAVLMILLPGAFANTVSQSNDGSAIGAGCQGIITQDGLNAALAIGAGNGITQKNDQSADSMGYFYVDQDAVNAALAFGTGNSIFQSNTADGVGGVVFQKQLNAIVAMGHGNKVDQSNYAKAVEELPYSYITQCQTNLGMVAGKNNDLSQSNTADAALPKKCDKIEIDPVILQVQANNALQLGKANKMDQSNTVLAEIQACTGAGGCLAVGDLAPGYAWMWDNGCWFTGDAYGSPMSYATIAPACTYSAAYQFQTNNGAQIGKGNTMYQSNFADAKIAFAAFVDASADAEGCSGALAEAGDDNKPYTGAYAYASHYASADAAASAVVAPTTVMQNQVNNGAQMGKFNTMVQSNAAEADIEAVAFAKASAHADADSYAAACAPVVWKWEKIGNGFCDWGLVAHGSNADAVAYANAYAAAQANAVVGTSTIVQNQANNGMQLGKFNYMYQSNDASADIGAWARAEAKADADACSTAGAIGVPCFGDAFAYANSQACAGAVAQAIVSPNTIEQNQVNNGVQLGKFNSMVQCNIEAADIKAFADAKAEASAGASANACAIGGYAYSDAYSSASGAASAYSGPNLIVQNQVNSGLELGKGGVLTQTNIANAEKPKIPTLDPIIIQNQANLGTLISTC
jgi:hypothetical protein